MKLTRVLMVIVATGIAVLLASTFAIGEPPAAPEGAKSIARAYLAACEKGDVEALNGLFLGGGKASVLENASDEGTWENYRDHHLAPKLKEMPGFKFTVKSEDVQKLGDSGASLVRHVGSFTVPDAKQASGVRTYRAAVSYVIVDDGGKPKIVHLHWSSREQRPPATQPSR